jgi:2-C-methyl-D-erythritol 2,4-cyclodiphosphate synthase
MRIRVGFGYDVHQLEAGRDLWLGGVKIPSEKGATGHSDADVLIHAICDALLGASSNHDIGFHFPDTSEEFKNISSRILLGRVVKLLKENGYSIGNVDSTVCLEQPKIAVYIPEMKKVLAEVMGINEDDVSVKATTAERLGFIGKGEGIEAYASILIYRD